MLRPVLAVILLLVGLAGFGLWRVLAGTEDLPFAVGASPPSSVEVTHDHMYSLAVPGGVRAMLARGVPVAGGSSGDLVSLQCNWAAPGGSAQALAVSAESTSTKAENTVGHFVSPLTGKLHVDCDGWGAMFIPDADDRSADLSGWALLAAAITLTIGALLGLSEVRLAWERSHGSRATDDRAEIQRVVDVAPVPGDDGNVAGDRHDIAP